MKTIRKTIQIYIAAALRYKLWLGLHLFLLTVAIILSNIVLPYIISKGINKLPEFLKNGNDFWQSFGPIIVLFILFEVTSWLCWRLGGVAVIKLEVSTMRDLYQKVFDHLSTMSNRFFNDTFSGSLVAQTNRFVSAYERLYDIFSFDLLGIMIRLGFSTIILYTFAPVVASGLLIWAIIYTCSAILLSIKKLPLSKEAAANQSKITARLADNLTNITNIKYFARENFEIKEFNKITNKAARSFYWDWGVAEAIYTWQGFLAVIFEIAVFWMSLNLVATHKIDLGQLILIQLYASNVIFSLWNVPRIVRRIEQCFADATEMTEIMNTHPEIVDVANPEKCKINKGNIVFDKVHFDHKDSSSKDPLFLDLCLEIKAGEKIGLAGPSGGGKTTLTKLLLRLSDLDSGKILIDNQDISRIKQNSLRSKITYVPQEPILFHRSILENISYGKPTALFDEIKEAAKKAHADTFIEKLPEGYDTLVGERGVKLSGGQRQRIAIARALLKDAPILVLDEATSALDSGSERLIQDALWKLMDGKTAIVVAHRLSTIQKLDRIVVLDDGKVAEEGAHQELINKGGLYSELWSHQSGGFIK